MPSSNYNSSKDQDSPVNQLEQEQEPPVPSKKEHRIWTPKETQLLKELLRDKKTMPEIVSILSRSEKSIRRKCETSGISSATVYDLRKREPTDFSQNVTKDDEE